MTLKKGDFIAIDFTGYTDEDSIFDTTKQDVAQKNGLYREGATFEPITLCLGEGHVLPGLDQALIGKKVSDSFEVTLEPENAFGKKRANLLKLMPITQFKKQKIKPVPGLEVSIDDMRGTIRSVSGNRVIVDFNHPLSGKQVRYDVHIQKQITDPKQQVETVVSIMLRFTPQVAVKDGKATLTLPIELPEELQKQLSDEVTRVCDVKEVAFATTQSKAGTKKGAVDKKAE